MRAPQAAAATELMAVEMSAAQLDEEEAAAAAASEQPGEPGATPALQDPAHVQARAAQAAAEQVRFRASGPTALASAIDLAAWRGPRVSSSFRLRHRLCLFFWYHIVWLLVWL